MMCIISNRTIETSKKNIDEESRSERNLRPYRHPMVASVQNSDVRTLKAKDTYGEEPRSPMKQLSDEFHVLRCESEESGMMFESQCNAQSSPKTTATGMTEVDSETETDAQGKAGNHI